MIMQVAMSCNYMVITIDWKSCFPFFTFYGLGRGVFSVDKLFVGAFNFE